MIKPSVPSESKSLILQTSALFCLLFGGVLCSEETATAGDLSGRFMAGPVVASVSGSTEEPVIASLFAVVEDGLPDVDASRVFMEMRGSVREVKFRDGQFSPTVILARPNDSIQIRNLDQEARLLNCYAGNELKQSVFLPQRGSFIRISQATAMEKKMRWVDVTSGRTVWVHETQSPWVNICFKTGEFQWRNVPAGIYRITIELRNQGVIDRTLSVSAESSHRFAFRVGASGLEWADSELK